MHVPSLKLVLTAASRLNIRPRSISLTSPGGGSHQFKCSIAGIEGHRAKHSGGKGDDAILRIAQRPTVSAYKEFRGNE